jgi:gamma-glutamylcyclotransferase (GGCT)/AIG2-like uncharacterized protein YtfP
MPGSISQQWNNEQFRQSLITALRAWNHAPLSIPEVDQQLAATLLKRLFIPLATEYAETARQTVDRLLDFPSHRLAVYGSLAPGKKNYHMMAGMEGSWRGAVLRGSLLNEGWGAGLGFPGFLWDGTQTPVAAQVFSSADLLQHWQRLDEFEGPEYRRILVPVEIEGVEIAVCNVYELVERD